MGALVSHPFPPEFVSYNSSLGRKLNVDGYPIVDATKIALETTRKFLEKDDKVTRVIYVVFSERDEKVYLQAVNEFFPGPPAE